MVELYIGTKSVEESNLFFRKLWSELDSISPNGWCYYPFRSNRKITIGSCNLGEVSFTYKTKGSIENLYIDADDSTGHIMEAIKRARSDYHCPSRFTVSVKLENKKAAFIEPICSRNAAIGREEDGNFLYFTILAFSKLDLKHLITNKLALIAYLLSEYTHILFGFTQFRYSGTNNLQEEKVPSNKSDYCYEWYDSDEMPENEYGQVILPDELLELINQILESDTYNENLQLLLNSAQLFYWSLFMETEAVTNVKSIQPGYLDIINSILISSLEPLSNIGAPKAEVCECCGATKYNVVSKLKDLTRRYLNEQISKDICKRAYRNRSAFLHTGTPITYEHYCGSVFPLIDVKEKNEMTKYPYFEYNIKDYTSYVFKKWRQNM